MNRSNFGANTNIVQIMLDGMLVLAAYGLTFLLVGTQVGREVYTNVATLSCVFGAILLLSKRGKDLYNITRFSYLDRLFFKQTGSFIVATIVVLLLIWNFEVTFIVKQYIWAFLVLHYILQCFKLVLVSIIATPVIT